MRMHEEKGLNPRLTYCPACHEEGQELLLLGAANKVLTCRDCGCRHYGGPPPGGACGGCGKVNPRFEVRELGDFEKIPGNVCGKCKEGMEVAAKEVARGGVYWKCKKCKGSGYMVAGSQIAEDVREHTGIAAPAPVGVTFDGCPSCEPEKYEVREEET